MADRPILFSAPMIRAILDRRKTQTRRVLKGQMPGMHLDRVGPTGWQWTGEGGLPRIPLTLRYAPGDLLWVREAVYTEELSRPQKTRPATPKEREAWKRTEVVILDELDGADGVRYVADNHWRIIENTREAADRWHDLHHYRGGRKGKRGNTVPPIHMPRWASRITLRVTDVKVERLQEISEADAIAEGCGLTTKQMETNAELITRPKPVHADSWRLITAHGNFLSLWCDIHGGLDAWDENPWVVAVEFEPIFKNIDEVAA